MRFGNCWLYAYFKTRREGGLMLTHWSHYGWWKHRLHMARDGTITHFVPAGEKRKRLIPPLLFRGEVQTLVQVDAKV